MYCTLMHHMVSLNPQSAVKVFLIMLLSRFSTLILTVSLNKEYHYQGDSKLEA